MRRISSRSTELIIAFVAMSVAVACGDSPTGPGSNRSPGQEILEPVGERVVNAVAGSMIDGPRVAVKDARTGLPLSGVEVVFRLIMGGWPREIAKVVTDDEGLASPSSWMVPQRTGSYVLEAISVGSRTGFLVQVKAGAPVHLQKADTLIAGIAGEDVPGPVVTVVDAYGNIALGHTVRFEVTGGGGSIAKSVVVTEPDGKAFPGNWRLGPHTADNVLVARVEGLPPVTIRTRGVERSSLDWYVLETEAAGIASSRVGLTTFDPCVCRDEEGYFVVEIDAMSWPRALVSGRFRIEPPRLLIRGDSGYPQGATSLSPLYLIGDQYRSLENDRITIELRRWDPQWWYWWPETWVYRKQP